MTDRKLSVPIALALVLAAGLPADAGWFRCRQRPRPCYRTSAPYAGTSPAPLASPQAVAAAPPVFAAAPAPAAGPLAWLNAVRQARGLRALALDPALDADARLNSSHGFGHNFMGRAHGQVVGLGPLASVEMLWLSSPAHFAILMSPSASYAGFGAAGNVSTIDVR